jgi:predicted AlkP superfamily phosphohydrolase/phosphomutase
VSFISPLNHLPLAYIGPGAGFAFLGSFLTLLLSLAASLASLLLWPFRMLRRILRKDAGMRTARVKRLIFLGLDGLDPAFTEKLMAAGKLPNLTRLKEEGSYRRLRTTFPALSPVAWSTFATGVNPARHNIFDSPNRDLQSCAPEPFSASVRLGQGKVSRPTVEMKRKSEPFWKILGHHAIESTILRVPATFPPDDFNGRLLSGTATPDLLGMQGGFSLFTRRPGLISLEGGNRYPLVEAGGTLAGELAAFGDSILFAILDPEGEPSLEIQGEVYPLKSHEYTPWIRLEFGPVHGIARFLVTHTGEDFSLYATAVQIDPENPALPISHPGYYATYLAKLLGSFSTLGMAEDTSALNEGAIDEDDFLLQTRLIQSEREEMFFSALDHQQSGVVACVFDTSDRVQHMFYRYLDPAHSVGRHSGVIERMYCDMDRLVGRTLEHASEHTAVFVLSDHGFCSFRRGVNLNSWLSENGYLTVDNGAIDWPRTRAFTVGLGGLYLNVRGREAQGTVDPADISGLSAELISHLAGLRDEATGQIAIQNVYAAKGIYSGPYLNAAPDLIVGYARGYRASWDAALGKVSTHIFEDNLKAWSGDHCVDPPLVPGVLFSNQKIDAEDPGIEDMAPTALQFFGIQPPEWMEGKSVIHFA